MVQRKMPLTKTPKRTRKGQADGDLEFRCKSGRYLLQPERVALWQVSTYPYLDVAAELQRARAWLLANPAKRKTQVGMERFLNAWLSRSDDRRRERARPKPLPVGYLEPPQAGHETPSALLAAHVARTVERFEDAAMALPGPLQGRLDTIRAGLPTCTTWEALAGLDAVVDTVVAQYAPFDLKQDAIRLAEDELRPYQGRLPDSEWQVSRKRAALRHLRTLLRLPRLDPRGS